jgi:hypothetical protein
VEHLRSQGIAVKRDEVPASALKASQNELVGAKVAGIAGAIESGKFDPTDEPIFVTRDDYVVDGHHRWAAAVAVDLKGKDGDIAVNVIDNDIIPVLAEAFRFAEDMGIPPKAAKPGTFVARLEQFHGNHNQLDHGKWARGGKSDKIVATPESTEMAESINAHAVAIEPEVTAFLADVIGDPDPTEYMAPGVRAPAELYGFDFRLKKKEDIAKKIERRMVEFGMSREDAAAMLNDPLRYTVHGAKDEIADIAWELHTRLIEGGNEVEVKNTWKPDSSYKGLHFNVVRPDGNRFEVQLHTPESSAVKNISDKIYKEERVLRPSDPRKMILGKEMKDLWDSLEHPPGFENFARHPRRFTVASPATLMLEGEVN